MRKSFILIFTIGFLVLFSAISALILSLSTNSVSSTYKLYLYNQAKLLARTGNEMALILLANRRLGSDKCLEKINLIDKEFNVTVNISYIGKDIDCNSLIFENSSRESNGTIILDVYVETTLENETIRFHRRSFQQP